MILSARLARKKQKTLHTHLSIPVELSPWPLDGFLLLNFFNEKESKIEKIEISALMDVIHQGKLNYLSLAMKNYPTA